MLQMENPPTGRNRLVGSVGEILPNSLKLPACCPGSTLDLVDSEKKTVGFDWIAKRPTNGYPDPVSCKLGKVKHAQ